MYKVVDINCDLGEGKTAKDCELDALIMPFISRCNIACGGHAGDQYTMQTTLDNAKSSGTKCGAHPGYPDPENFGRTSIKIPLKQLIANLLEQIERLASIASKNQQALSHIKLHGALYNDAEKSADLALGLCQALKEHYPMLTVLGLPNAAMQSAAESEGLTFMAEGFMDRAYLSSGHLAPRGLPGAVYSEIEVCIQQVMAMLSHQPLKAFLAANYQANEPSAVVIHADTFCLHGDSPIAISLAQTLHQRLKRHGYEVQ